MTKKALHIIKIGGHIINNNLALQKFVKQIRIIKEPMVIVHGGGRDATILAENLNIPQTFIEGKRVTSLETLQVAIMTYAGSINKNIVVQLQASQMNAVGLCGADGNLFRTYRRPITPIDYGFVGDIQTDSLNMSFCSLLIENRIIPTVCAITHDGNGQLLNTNADGIACEMAISLNTAYNTSLYYTFEHQGVLKDIKNPSSVIKNIDTHYFDELKEAKIIDSGMIPKITYALKAKASGVSFVGITNANTIGDTIDKKQWNGTEIS